MGDASLTGVIAAGQTIAHHDQALGGLPRPCFLIAVVSGAEIAFTEAAPAV